MGITLTTTRAPSILEHGFLFATVEIAGEYYEVASLSSSTSARIVKLTRWEARCRRLGERLERKGIRF